MAQSSQRQETRKLLKQKLCELIVALRDNVGEGNIIVRVPQTGDLVAILLIDEEEASELAALLTLRP